MRLAVLFAFCRTGFALRIGLERNIEQVAVLCATAFAFLKGCSVTGAGTAIDSLLCHMR